MQGYRANEVFWLDETNNLRQNTGMVVHITRLITSTTFWFVVCPMLCNAWTEYKFTCVWVWGCVCVMTVYVCNFVLNKDYNVMLHYIVDVCNTSFIYTPCSKKPSRLMFIITLANVDIFSKFFYQEICKKILYVHITKIFISPATCCYTTLWKPKTKNVTKFSRWT